MLTFTMHYTNTKYIWLASEHVLYTPVHMQYSQSLRVIRLIAFKFMTPPWQLLEQVLSFLSSSFFISNMYSINILVYSVYCVM